MAKLKFDQSIAEGYHAELNKLVGSWRGSCKVWFTPEETADDSPIEGTIRSVLDQRFILHEYRGFFQGKPLSGIAMLGYNLNAEQFQYSWVDSFHMSTGIMFSESAVNENKIVVLGHYSSYGKNPEIWGWRTEFDLKSADHLLITAYNISPAGEESKATEIEYQRL